MKTDYIVPFISATIETFETMCEMTPARNGKVTVEAGVGATYDTIAVIGLSGKTRGMVMITAPMSIACRIVGAFVGEEVEMFSDDLTDGLGEIINIIGGAAIANLAELQMKLSLPTVLMGKGSMISGSKTAPCLVIPMGVEGTDTIFKLKISLEDN